jgi:predicted dehydrogenase
MEAIRRQGRFEAALVLGPDRGPAERAARWTFSDTETLLRESEPQGVVLLAPIAERPALVKQCLAAGAAVLVLGSPGPSRGCQRAASLSRLAGRFVLAASPLRFSPAVVLARRLLDSGKFGRPLSMIVRSLWRGGRRAGSEDDGVVPLDQVFEAVDLICHLLGPIESAYSIDHPEGALAAVLASADRVPITLNLHASGSADACGLELELRSTEGGSLVIDRDCRLTSASQGGRVDAAHRPSLPSADPVIELGYDGLLHHFARLVTARGGGWAGPVQALAAAAEAVLASAARGRPVALGQPHRAASGRMEAAGA